jgi:hypothetical protein
MDKNMNRQRIKNPSSLIILFLLLAITFCPKCQKKSTDPDSLNGSFIIRNLGVNFGPWNPATNRAGDFLFLASENKVFLEFGAEVGTPGGGTKELPTFEYKIRKDAFVFAITEGRVNRFDYQSGTQDYEIGTVSTVNPDWEVGYDHVKNPRVGLNDELSPGDTLGNPGTWNSTLGRFEIMINNRSTDLSYCPFCCFDSDSSESYQMKVLQHMLDWEAFKGDTAIFDEKNHVYPGCRMESMVTY